MSPVHQHPRKTPVTSRSRASIPRPKTKQQDAAAANKRPEVSPFVGRPIYFASASETNVEKHTNFEAVFIHTAKCDGCEKHNTSVIQRCLTCSRQMCRPCMVFDRNGIHCIRNNLNWTPSTVPYTGLRPAGRLGEGRVVKKAVGTRVKSSVRVTKSDDESDVAGTEDIQSMVKRSDSATQETTASRKVSRKRKERSNDTQEGIFVTESEGDDEYIPPASKRIFAPRKKAMTSKSMISQTLSRDIAVGGSSSAIKESIILAATNRRLSSSSFSSLSSLQTVDGINERLGSAKKADEVAKVVKGAEALMRLADVLS